MARYLASLARLLARPPRDAAARAWSGDRRWTARSCASTSHTARMREERVRGALDGVAAHGRGAVAGGLRRHPRLLWPLAERSLLAHLDKLVRDGRARQLDGAEPRWSR